MKKFLQILLVCICLFSLAGCGASDAISAKLDKAKQEQEAKKELAAAKQAEYDAEYRKSQTEQEIKDAGFISNALSYVPVLGKHTKAGKAKERLKEDETELNDARSATDDARTSLASLTGKSEDTGQSALIKKNMLWIIIGVAGFLLLVLIIFMISKSKNNVQAQAPVVIAAPAPQPAPAPAPAPQPEVLIKSQQDFLSACKKLGVNANESNIENAASTIVNAAPALAKQKLAEQPNMDLYEQAVFVLERRYL